MPNLIVLDHPLIRHKLARLRDVKTDAREFRQLAGEIAALMTWEATRTLPTEPIEVVTPMERTTGHRLAAQIALVPILRAGLGMVDGVLSLLPQARVGHIGLYRDHATLLPVPYYFKVPTPATEYHFLVLDPMLATGGSAVEAVRTLKQAGASAIVLLCLVAAPEGVEEFSAHHPDVPIYAAALDRELNQQGYILPGLGDAGDRIFGTT
jgi:uracil phosphoribosyltransferase